MINKQNTTQHRKTAEFQLCWFTERTS